MSKVSEKKIQNEAFRTLAQYGYVIYVGRDHYSGVDENNVELENPGRADLLFVKSLSAAIEVKAFGNEFRFSEVRDNQLQWAQEYWVSPKGANALYWIWAGAGSGRPHANTSLRRRTWLIPLDAFLYWKCKVQNLTGILTIPLVPGIKQRERAAVQKHKLYATRIFAPYELSWDGNSRWKIPEYHSFRSEYSV